jgi:type I restriction enzyme S subunit
MNPRQLLDDFDRVSEAPEAIPRLRGFILDLAVRGKLVEQNPKDEPASYLLKRIHAEKTRVLKTGGIRKEKALPPLVEDQIPFRIPKNWSWSQLGEIGFLNPRNSAADELAASFVPMPLISAQYGVAARHEVRPWGQIKSGYTHLAEGDVAVAKITPCFENGKSAVFRGLSGRLGAGTTELHIVRPVFVSADYVLIFLKSPHFIESGIPRMTGTAGQKRVPTDYVAYSPFPLAPLAEQHRIVAKVNELMALCDRLETAQVEREQRRDRLAEASLHRLNQPADTGKSPTFREHARFHLSNLSRFTTRPDQIPDLRRSILNLAVRGCLVAPDPDDEPIFELIKRIQSEQAELARLGKLKRYDPSAAFHVLDVPFHLPSSWQWTTLERIIVFGPQNGVSPKPSSRPDAPKAITLSATTKGVFQPQYFKYVEATIPKDSEFWLRPGDLLFQRGNTREYVGIAAYYDGGPERFLYPDLIMKVRLSKQIDLRFVHLWSIAPFARTYFSTHASGAQSTMPKINQATLMRLPLALPPVAEQHRIVAKVDELMAVCDQLEAQLTTAQIEGRRLLEAILHEALVPAA